MDENLNLLLNEANEIKDGYVIALFTDEVYIEKWEHGSIEQIKTKIFNCKDSLLELRVFDTNMETKLFRTVVNDNNVKYRVIDDRKNKEQDNNEISSCEDYYDENQFLDIDTTIIKSFKNDSSDWNIQATGGGEYHLPKGIEDINDLTLKVRHYISRYPDSGKAYVSDWRCVGFECVKLQKGGN